MATEESTKAAGLYQEEVLAIMKSYLSLAANLDNLKGHISTEVEMQDLFIDLGSCIDLLPTLDRNGIQIEANGGK